MIDTVWELKYKSGFEQPYPWDNVVKPKYFKNVGERNS